MKIKNFNDIATTKEREAALQIAEAGYQAIDTREVVKRGVRVEDNTLFVQEKEFSLKDVEQVLVVGVGKCSLEAATALEEVLGDRVTGGMVLDVREGQLKKLKSYAGDHPFPTEKSFGITKRIVELLKESTEKDFVIFIISGGGSALLCYPDQHTCQQETELVQCLFRLGATIQELNIVRKHISLARGGYLAKYAYPSKAVALIFSDVPGDNLEFISSGPTVKDTTTIQDAKSVLEKYNITERCAFQPEMLLETPKEEKYFENISNILFLSNTTALQAMSTKAAELGLSPDIRTSTLQGEAKKVGAQVAAELQKAKEKTVLLYGGETTVVIRGKGKGGRSLEVALSALPALKEHQVICVFASDGWDNTEFAGAICDIITKQKAGKLGLSVKKALANNQSFNFFEQTGDYLMTGYTGSNVSDLLIALTI